VEATNEFDEGVVLSGQPQRLPPQVQAWVDARQRYRLSHAHVMMARELGLNPRKFGKLANHSQEPWKSPLPVFIEDLYLKRFGRERPEVVTPIEHLHRQKQQNKATNRAKEQRHTGAEVSDGNDDPSHP
jgi:hypothetical protein